MHIQKHASLQHRTWYPWLVSAACFLMVFTCLGFCSSTKGLYLAAITDTLGIKRSLYSFNDTFRYVATTFVNLFFGAVIARFGSRKVVAAGFACLITSMLIYSFAEAVYVFYLGGLFLGAGLAWTTTSMVGYVVDRWVTNHRGTIMGAVMAANGLGGALASQIVSPIIYRDGLGNGFRLSYRITALILLVVGTLVVLVLRDKPEEMGAAAAVRKKKARANTWDGISLKEALHKPYFYAAVAFVFLGGVVLQGTQSVTAAHLKDAGFSPSHVAMVLSVHSLSLCAMKFLTGIAYDKLGIRVTTMICSIACIAMILLLQMIEPGPLGNVLAIVQGVVAAVGLPLETILLPLLTGEMFGKKDYAKLMGIITASSAAGCAIGIPAINLFYDLLGAYRPALLGLSVLMVFVAAGNLLVLVAAAREREKRT